ncbi:ribonuclease P protein subunit [Candidatus Woesearchaeota archaeon]|nr:ribonuclease P protein subunit [Candidatus Woesearchaeota archaeon]
MNLKDFLKTEMIGLKMEVLEAKNKNLIGMKGVIVDETKNTLVIKNEKEEMKTILKDQVVLKIHYKGNEIKVNGDLLLGRPEDRLKK